MRESLWPPRCGLDPEASGGADLAPRHRGQMLELSLKVNAESMKDIRTNEGLATSLERISDLLEFQGANPFRVRSYRRAAATLREHSAPVVDLFSAEGEVGLRGLPGIGEGLGGAIAEILETGRSRLLDRLESEVAPEEIFCRLPGVGPTLARRLHDELGVHTLEELEVAAQQGRLREIEGIGRRKEEGITDALAGMLARRGRRRSPQRASRRSRPNVELLLELDAEYRRRAEAGQLRRIAPRRFNPEHRAWLPIMEAEREGWEFTLLFSNTRRAHELDRTDDWVVVYYHRNGDEDQCTIVTAGTGALRGLRVVRGREAECADLYRLRA